MEKQSVLAEMMHDLVLESPRSARELAKGVGKPYSTLLREVNPHDTKAKLGMETMLELMQLTGNVDPLDYMARLLGYSLSPLGCRQAEATDRPDTANTL